MFKKRKTRLTTPLRRDWRKFQGDLQRSESRGRSFKKILRYGVITLALGAGIFAVIIGFGGAACNRSLKEGPTGSSTRASGTEGLQGKLDKRQVRDILGDRRLLNLRQKQLVIDTPKRRLLVETSLEISLQNYLLERLNRSTSRYIGIVAMDAVTGRVLAMVGFDKNDSSNNPCVDSHFPAASIFKIVTAAAVIEQFGYGPDTQLTYNGRKYTLYKSQLKEKKNKWTRNISLKDSFAQSVNPVFGKIGALVLGKPLLEEYALAFGFNHGIPFEIPLQQSMVNIGNAPYGWAEIASGFNRQTLISPLHAAVMASAIPNSGQLIEPTVIDRISDERGRILYRGNPKIIRQAVKPEASRSLGRLMAETIRTGTCRKAFRGYRRDKVLSRLNIGGKTGSINGQTPNTRYDWFVGFAEEKKGPEKIVFAIVVAHEEYIGTRASAYARMAMKQYFKQYFAEIEKRQAES